MHSVSLSGGAIYSITSWRSVVRAVKAMCDKGFAVNVRFVFGGLCLGCAVVVLKIFRRKEILKNNFDWVEKGQALLQVLVCGFALAGLANVLDTVCLLLSKQGVY